MPNATAVAIRDPFLEAIATIPVVTNYRRKQRILLGLAAGALALASTAIVLQLTAASSGTSLLLGVLGILALLFLWLLNPWGQEMPVIDANKRSQFDSLGYFLEWSGKTVRGIRGMERTEVEEFAQNLLVELIRKVRVRVEHRLKIPRTIGYLLSQDVLENLQKEIEEETAGAYGHLKRLNLVDRDFGFYQELAEASAA